MTLLFSTEWPDRMGDLACSPNNFIEKIWTGLPHDINPDYYCFVEEYLERFGEYWDGSWTDDTETCFFQKIHTIREDASNRWKAGMDIHFVINNRTKNRFQFAPILKCLGVQEIEIKQMIMTETDRCIVVNGNIYVVEVDGKRLGKNSIAVLALNDGFDTVEDFFGYFNKDFKGKIIHWTDLKY